MFKAKLLAIFSKGQKVDQVIYCCSMEKFSAYILLDVPYGRFGFSRPDLDGNKLVKVSAL